MNLKFSSILELITFSLLIGLSCYLLEYLAYQRYLEEIFSVKEITLHPYPFTLTFWNFSFPIMLITFCFSVIKNKFFKDTKTTFFEFLGGIILGIICVFFGLMLTIFNHLLAYFFLGEYDNSYYPGLPLYGYPLNLVAIIPVLYFIYQMLRRIVKIPIKF